MEILYQKAVHVPNETNWTLLKFVVYSLNLTLQLNKFGMNSLINKLLSGTQYAFSLTEPKYSLQEH